ncbi:MAG: hypothetical protein ABUL41_02770 [Chitinophagaceae bacterium]
MKSKGRPRMSPVQLKNGFYIEVCNKGMKKGMKIRSESKKAMEDAARLYSYKEVIVLGEYKDGEPIIQIPV